MTVSPSPMFPEKAPNVFERSMAPSIPGNRGPLRFEEGVATDTRKPEEVGRLKDEDDLRRKAIHVVQGIKDKYDYDYSED